MRNLRHLGMTVLCVLAASAGPLAIASPGADSHVRAGGQAGVEPTPSPALSLEERVACREAIERVYWSHRNGAKSPFDEAVPEELLHRQAQDQRLMLEALRQRWGERIARSQVQAELDRMARSSRAPDRLREIFAALDHDPRLVGECLVKPLLAEKRLRALYARDPQLHHGTRTRAEAELAGATGPADLVGLGDVSHELVLAKGRSGKREVRGARTTSEHDRGVVRISADEWTRRVAPLRRDTEAGASNTLDARRRAPGSRASAEGRASREPAASPPAVSGLRESERFFFVEGLVRTSDEQATLRIVRWSKRPFGEWWEQTRRELLAERRMPRRSGRSRVAEPAPTSAPLRLPEVTASSCEPGTWRPTRADLPDPRWNHTAVWTGSEMIVWGGEQALDLPAAGLRTGAAYDPATDTWTPTPVTSAAPSRRTNHTAVWTGEEMIVWGGRSFESELAVSYRGDGAAYDPVNETWRPLDATEAPDARALHTAVWTSEEMIVWGGFNDSGVSNTGAAYDPNADAWTELPTDGAPQARGWHTAVWDAGGERMIVWGGSPDGFALLDTGGVYEVQSASWSPMTTTEAPEGRWGHVAVWTGEEMIVWGGSSLDALSTGGRYDPDADAWTPVSTDGAPSARDFHVGIWTGEEMIVWGGQDFEDPANYFSDGGRYDPADDSWSPLDASGPAPLGRASPAAIWTGEEMIVWGGVDDLGAMSTGGRFDAGRASWAPTSTASRLPYAHAEPAGVWTGSELIVWGGSSIDFGFLDIGSRYDPATDAWTPMGDQASAPDGRAVPSTVWTGEEMIVWGGYTIEGDALTDLDTGGRYDPVADAWTPIANASAPEARSYHTAVWDAGDGRMMVWGGARYDAGSQADEPLGTGGSYDPSSDSWTDLPTANAPSPRWFHTAVWTGQEMIVWGGYENLSETCLGSGARYDPSAGTWASLPAPSGLPVGCGFHSAVWTGEEMIVWGGLCPDAGSGCPSGGGASGGLYDPAGDAWAPMSLSGEPRERYAQRAVWTGEEMIVWGGEWVDPDNAVLFGDGGRYAPGDDTWAPTEGGGQVPHPRSSHLAAATASEMIIWGGYPDTASGGLYCFGCADAVWYRDADGDGFGDAGDTVTGGCEPPDGYVGNDEDCDDADPDVNPDQAEVQGNGIDDDCDGTIDEQPGLSISLSDGWTLTGAAFELGMTASEICDEITSQGGAPERISRWTGSVWQTHTCGVPINDFDVGGGSGLFVRATAASIWGQSGADLAEPFPIAVSGWTLMTLPAWAAPRQASEICDQVDSDGGSAERVSLWTGSVWQTHTCGVPINDFQVTPGAGFFLRVSGSSTWTIE